MANVSSIVNSMKSLALASAAFVAVLVPSKNKIKSLALGATALATGFSTSSCTTDTFQQDGRGGYTRTTSGFTSVDLLQGAVIVAGYATANKHLNNRDRDSARRYNYANNALHHVSGGGGVSNRPGSGNRPGPGGGVSNRPGSGNFPSRPTYNPSHDILYQCAKGLEYHTGNDITHATGNATYRSSSSSRSGGRLRN